MTGQYFVSEALQELHKSPGRFQSRPVTGDREAKINLHASRVLHGPGTVRRA
jgi:hypothetical protein